MRGFERGGALARRSQKHLASFFVDGYLIAVELLLLVIHLLLKL